MKISNDCYTNCEYKYLHKCNRLKGFCEKRTNIFSDKENQHNKKD
ncbi:hypothetical protein LCGC14_0846440 [marine sediment metagenome]|uniref:Uncharacterized protein n=1 Tax=marine sediment metagenome TaxID=412755 RepID=A0A0F9RWB9_9ZZZZ